MFQQWMTIKALLKKAKAFSVKIVIRIVNKMRTSYQDLLRMSMKEWVRYQSITILNLPKCRRKIIILRILLPLPLLLLILILRKKFLIRIILVDKWIKINIIICYQKKNILNRLLQIWTMTKRSWNWLRTWQLRNFKTWRRRKTEIRTSTPAKISSDSKERFNSTG